MRLFKTKVFTKWARKAGITDQALCQAVDEMDRDVIRGKLSEFVYKRRIALPGRGKSGGVRTILAFKAQKRTVFIFGYAKNEMETIRNAELERLKTLASLYMSYSENQLQIALKEGELIEVIYHE